MGPAEDALPPTVDFYSAPFIFIYQFGISSCTSDLFHCLVLRRVKACISLDVFFKRNWILYYEVVIVALTSFTITWLLLYFSLTQTKFVITVPCSFEESLRASLEKRRRIGESSSLTPPVGKPSTVDFASNEALSTVASGALRKEVFVSLQGILDLKSEPIVVVSVRQRRISMNLRNTLLTLIKLQTDCFCFQTNG